MPQNIIRKRSRFFVAGEGESEQSFVKWLQELTDIEELYVHLHCEPLGGGGYNRMSDRAVTYRKRGLTRGTYKQSFLLVDGDRTLSGQDWTMDQLRTEVAAET